MQAASSGDGTQPPARSVQKEEEILLLYEITETHGTHKDFEKLVSSPVFGPRTLFRQGRKELFLRVIARHRRDGDWEAIYHLCNDCLSEKDADGKPNLLASDYHVWEEFIHSASQIKVADETAVETVQGLLLQLIKSPNLRPIYRRNVLLARVSATFQLISDETDDSVDGQASSTRLQELTRYIEDQANSPACFDDIKPFVEKLDRSGMDHLAQEFLPQLCKKRESEGDAEARQARLLSLKVRYLMATCPLSYSSVPDEAAARTRCFTSIWQDGLEFYKDIATKSADTLSVDPQLPPELALLVAFCSIKLANTDPNGSLASIPASSRRHFFHAILLLEYQLSFSPKNSQLLLVLVQLHLLLGSAPRSRQLWDELGVKRTIMDSLAPLVYDRLSLTSPALLSPSENWGWQLMDMLTSHFSYSLKLRMPRRLVDAFESESYSSVLEIPKYIHNLRTSTTRAMSLVEETRSERVLGAPTWELFSDPRFSTMPLPPPFSHPRLFWR